MTRLLCAAAASAALLAAPATGHAAVTIGEDTATPGGLGIGCSSSPDARCTFANTQVPGAVLTAPFDGVVVRWRIRGTNATGNMRIRILRPAGGTQFTGAGTGTFESVPPEVESLFPAKLPIRQGDLIGVDIPADPSVPAVARRSTAGGQFQYWFPEYLADGATTPSFGTNSNETILLNADIEPDCDSDGFGDETQDPDVTGCPPPPDTVISKGPKPKTRKKKATFEFTSSETATFECSVDDAAFAICASPFTVTLGKGKHSFSVRAVDTGGNADQTPATDDWKVKKRKRR
jgi:hypothetical protein